MSREVENALALEYFVFDEFVSGMVSRLWGSSGLPVGNENQSQYSYYILKFYASQVRAGYQDLTSSLLLPRPGRR